MPPTHFVDEDKAICRHSGACLTHSFSLAGPVSPPFVVGAPLRSC